MFFFDNDSDTQKDQVFSVNLWPYFINLKGLRFIYYTHYGQLQLNIIYIFCNGFYQIEKEGTQRERTGEGAAAERVMYKKRH